MTIHEPARPAPLAHGSDRARRGCACGLCQSTDIATGGMIRRPIVTDVVLAAIRRHLDELDDGGSLRPDLAVAALRLAAVLDSNRPDDRLQHRAATVELVELLGLLARERTLRTATRER